MATLPREIEFYTASEGHRLAVRLWPASLPARARVVFVHGIRSHGGWYGQCAEHLAAAGFEVAFLDRRGSGLNGQQAGDVSEWQVWLEDVARYVCSRNEAVGSADAAAGQANSVARLPNVLCGISWGGKLAAAVVRRYPALFAGVALVCPGLYSPFMPGLCKKLVLAAPASARLRQKRLPVPLRDAKLFTGTPSWQRFIARDPLALRTITWRFAQQDRRLTRYAREAATFLHLPVLVQLAGQDRIIDNAGLRRYFGRIPSRHKMLIEYYGAGHTLEFEPNPQLYFDDLARWCGQVAAQASAF